jgi:hypothetical protein
VGLGALHTTSTTPEVQTTKLMFNVMLAKVAKIPLPCWNAGNCDRAKCPLQHAGERITNGGIADEDVALQVAMAQSLETTCRICGNTFADEHLLQDHLQTCFDKVEEVKRSSVVDEEIPFLPEAGTPGDNHEVSVSTSPLLSSTLDSNACETEELLTNYSKMVLSDVSFNFSLDNDLFGEEVNAKEFLNKLVKVLQQSCQKLVEKDAELLETMKKCEEKDAQLLELKELIALRNSSESAINDQDSPCENCGDVLINRYRQRLIDAEDALEAKESEVSELLENVIQKAESLNHYMDENQTLKSKIKQQRQHHQVIEEDLDGVVRKIEFEKFKHSVSEKLAKLTEKIMANPNGSVEKSVRFGAVTPYDSPPPVYSPSRQQDALQQSQQQQNQHQQQKQQLVTQQKQQQQQQTAKTVADNLIKQKLEQKQQKEKQKKTKTRKKKQDLERDRMAELGEKDMKAINEQIERQDKQEKEKQLERERLLDESKKKTELKEIENVLSRLLPMLNQPTVLPSDNPCEELAEGMAPWEKHTNGFPSTYMRNKGFQAGGGLGKNGDGITSPIKPTQTSFSPRKDNLYHYVGTSMIGGIKEKVLSKKSNAKVKVYPHPGATIKDIKDHLAAHLRKKPTHLILQCGTNDAVDKNVTSDIIYDRLIDLKNFAESTVPGIMVTISCPMVRSDNKWANAKLVWLKKRLMREEGRSGLSIIVNDNITYDHLGENSGLHLKQVGTNILYGNISNFIRSVDKGH